MAALRLENKANRKGHEHVRNRSPHTVSRIGRATLPFRRDSADKDTADPLHIQVGIRTQRNRQEKCRCPVEERER